MNDDPMHQTTGNGREIPLQCVLHGNDLAEIKGSVHDLKTAVIGDERIGVKGVVKQMEDMMIWRQKLELRVAAIGGGAAVVMVILEKLFWK